MRLTLWWDPADMVAVHCPSHASYDQTHSALALGINNQLWTPTMIDKFGIVYDE